MAKIMQPSLGRLLTAVAATITMLLLTGPGGGDHLTLQPAPTQEVRMLIHAETNPDPNKRDTFSCTCEDQMLPNLKGTGDAVAFPADPSFRPTRTKVSSWLTGSKTVTLSLLPAAVLNLTVWIVYPGSDNPTDTKVQEKFWNDYAETQAIFDREHLGIRFNSITVITTDQIPNWKSYKDFTCSNKTALQQPAASGGIGKENDRINIYYFRKVADENNEGKTCGYCGDFIAIAYKSEPHVLAHEIGHTLCLNHAEDLITQGYEFNNNNMMYGYTDERLYLSEGQNYRAHLYCNSILNKNGYTSDRPANNTLFNCSGGTSMPHPATGVIPAIDFRLWKDMPPGDEE